MEGYANDLGYFRGAAGFDIVAAALMKRSRSTSDAHSCTCDQQKRRQQARVMYRLCVPGINLVELA